MSAHNGHVSEDELRPGRRTQGVQQSPIGSSVKKSLRISIGEDGVSHPPGAQSQYAGNNGTRIYLNEEATPWERLGPAQVESLLAFVVSPDVERAMEHAEIEGRVEDRVIRRKHGILD